MRGDGTTGCSSGDGKDQPGGREHTGRSLMWHCENHDNVRERDETNDQNRTTQQVMCCARMDCSVRLRSRARLWLGTTTETNGVIVFFGDYSLPILAHRQDPFRRSPAILAC